MKVTKKIKRNLIVSILLVLFFLVIYLIFMPDKIPIKHELIIDKKLQIGDSYYEISKRYKLINESEFSWTDQIIDSNVLNKYESLFGCTQMKDSRGLFIFSEGLFSWNQKLMEFDLVIHADSDGQCFKKLTKYLLEKAINDHGKKYKTRFEKNKSEFVWEYDDYNFIISIYQIGYFHYDLDKQRIYLKWLKKLNEFK
jgi:hypothetical protein